MADLFGNHIVGFPTRRLRCMKFWIKVEEEMYYLCSENKGADQLCSFAYAKGQFSRDMTQLSGD